MEGMHAQITSIRECSDDDLRCQKERGDEHAERDLLPVPRENPGADRVDAVDTRDDGQDRIDIEDRVPHESSVPYPRID